MGQELDGIRLRVAGEKINSQGRWAAFVDHWSGPIPSPSHSGNTLARMRAEELIRGRLRDLAQRADYRNLRVEAQIVVKPIPVSAGADFDLTMADSVRHGLWVWDESGLDEDEFEDVRPHVLIVGNPVQGVRVIGPFADADTAQDHASAWSDTDWWLAELEPPKEED